MKLVKKVRLVFKENKSDKVYEVDLVELPKSDAARYLVNFRFGRRGRDLREGTKTAQPVTLSEAEALYNSVVVSKTTKGYWDESGPAPVNRTPAAKVIEPPTAASQASRVAALLKALAAETHSKLRARLIWTLGSYALEADAIHAAAKVVSANVKRGDWTEDYSIAWTLGRWRDQNSLSTLEQLQKQGDPQVRRIAQEAILIAMAPSHAANTIRPELDQLPATLRNAIDANNEGDIVQALHQEIDRSAKSGSANTSLEVCYRWALASPAVLRALLSVLTTCPLQPGTFKAIRHIFKTAELRIDHEMLACLTHRFETTKEYFSSNFDWAYVPTQGSMSVSKELPKDNSRLAYSQRTRLYLRKRAWRTLKKLGRANNVAYVSLAKAVLLRVSEADKCSARTGDTYSYPGGDRSKKPILVKRTFDEYANLLVFNHILREEHPAFALISSGKAWFSTNSSNEGVRGEAFPHLWDQNPGAALDLLKYGACAPIHDAAIRILSSHTEFLSKLSSNEVATLLLSNYAQTAEFALPLAEALFAGGLGDDTLILALLKSISSSANDFGIRVLAAQTDLTANTALLVELLLIFTGPTPALVRDALQRQPVPADQQPLIVANFIIQLLARNIELTSDAAESTSTLFIERFPAGVNQLALTLIDRLLAYSDIGRQLLGARLLVANQIGFREIPERMLQHIHGSAHDQVKAIAIALLNKQTDDELIAQVNMLVELYHRGATAERREMLQVLARLASRSTENQVSIVQAMLGILFRSAQDDTQTEEVAAFFDTNLRNAAATLDKDTIWRLLQAQSVTAQKIGVSLLRDRSPTEFTVRQWSKLMQHPDLAARDFAIAAFETHVQLIKENTRDALRLFDTKWENARAFGFRFFRDRYTDSDWSPEYVVALCDSTLNDVQNFGREILQRFFHQEQGPRYLAMLSQHPSTNVQLFVSNFLEDHAAGHKERVLLLRDFFVTVLSHINKARVCKDRVRQFLLQQALLDREVAQMAASVFTRLSLTMVNKDRTELIKAMLALRAKYPDLSLPITAVPRSGARPVEVRNGI